MALPLAPAAGIAAKYTAVLLAGYTLARALPAKAPDRRVEAAMDELPDGISLSADGDTSRIAARWRRVLTLGGRGVRLDASLFGRLKVARA